MLPIVHPSLLQHASIKVVLSFRIILPDACRSKSLMKCLPQRPRLSRLQQVQYLHHHRGKRSSVECSGAPKESSSSAPEQAVRPGDVTVTRRHALLAATCACIAARCAPAKAAIIDEVQAQEIFEQVSDSVVSIANVKQTGKRGCWCAACMHRSAAQPCRPACDTRTVSCARLSWCKFSAVLTTAHKL